MDDFMESLDRTSPHVRWSIPEDQRPGTDLLILLHGFGSDEADLWPLVEHMPEAITVASVRAPSAFGPGYQWFPLDIQESDAPVFRADEKLALASAQWLQAWVDSIKETFRTVSVLGFSQGMCMASSLLRLSPRDYLSVVGLSGFVLPVEAPEFQDALVKELRPPFFWGRDQEDPVIAQSWVESTNAWLQSHVDLTKVLYTGVGHGISQQELRHIGEFLGHVLGARHG